MLISLEQKDIRTNGNATDDLGGIIFVKQEFSRHQHRFLYLWPPAPNGRSTCSQQRQLCTGQSPPSRHWAPVIIFPFILLLHDPESHPGVRAGTTHILPTVLQRRYCPSQELFWLYGLSSEALGRLCVLSLPTQFYVVSVQAVRHTVAGQTPQANRLDLNLSSSHSLSVYFQASYSRQLSVFPAGK